MRIIGEMVEVGKLQDGCTGFTLDCAGSQVRVTGLDVSEVRQCGRFFGAFVALDIGAASVAEADSVRHKRSRS